MFETYDAHPPHLPVAQHTMDVAFCHQCQGELTVELLLRDSIWAEIVAVTNRDLQKRKNSVGEKMQLPKLDRGRTRLQWTPFVRTAGPSILKPGGLRGI
jgi:hypothetical protein